MILYRIFPEWREEWIWINSISFYILHLFFCNKQSTAVNSCIPVDPSTWWIGNLPWGKSYLLDKHQAMKATEYSIPTSWSTSQVWLEKVIRGTSWEAMRLRDVPLRYRCGTITPSLSPSSSSRTAKHHQMVLKPVFFAFLLFSRKSFAVNWRWRAMFRFHKFVSILTSF